MAVAFNQSYSDAQVITPDDGINFDGSDSTTGQNVRPCDAIYVGTVSGGGVVAAVLQNGLVVNFTAVAGEILPVRAIRVNSTDTTATALVAFYSE